MEHTAPKAPTIEVDGISEEFFHLLWSKDELNFGPSIQIPDTVIFKYGQPVTWYFTASNGKIKKKNRNNLLNARIEDAFTKNVLGYDVIATFISFGNLPTTDNRSQSAEPVVRNTIEYLDRKEFQKFLYERFESNSGILQKFIEPKGTKNESIRAIWSPKICLLERAENIYQLHDHRYGLYERCVTYEGPEFYCTSAPLRGPVLAGKIQRLCESIVAHISEVTFAQSQVSRIVLNYKVDSRDQVWLLYSTSIRCSSPPALFGQEPLPNPSLVNIDNVLSLPSTVYLNPNRSYDNAASNSNKHKLKLPQKEIHCLSCGGATLENLRHPMQYKTIIKHYEHILFLIQELSDPNEILKWPPKPEIIESAGGVGFGCLVLPTSSSSSGADNEIGKPKKMDLTKPLEMDELRIPPILRYIHPKLSARSYQQCRKDPLFLYKTVMLCENCYLIYAEFTTMLLKLGTDLTKLFSRVGGPSGITSASAYGEEMSPTTRGGGGGGGGGVGRAGNHHRPSSSDWRAMSTSMTASASSSHQKLTSSTLPSAMPRGYLNPSENHLIAKENSIGLRVNEPNEIKEQPSIPSTIRNKIESIHLIAETRKDNYRTLSALDHPSHGPPGEGGGAAGGGGRGGGAGAGGGLSQTSLKDYYTDEDLKEMIANRERHFYKEISKNPQLSHQHPLIHLINSQQKLRLADEQSGVLNTRNGGRGDRGGGDRGGGGGGGEGIYSETYGKPEERKKNKFHCYEEPIKFIGPPNITSASSISATTGTLLPVRSRGGHGNGKRSKNMSGNRSLASYASSSTAKSTSSLALERDPLTSESMKKHSEFLTETLQLVSQMETENGQSNVLMEERGEKGLLLKTKHQQQQKEREKNKATSAATASGGPRSAGNSPSIASGSKKPKKKERGAGTTTGGGGDGTEIGTEDRLESSSTSSPSPSVASAVSAPLAPTPSPSAPAPAPLTVSMPQDERKLSSAKEDLSSPRKGGGSNSVADEGEWERAQLRSRHEVAVGAAGDILSEGISRAVKDIIDSDA